MRLPGRRKRRESELREEIRSHLNMAARDRVERGEAASEARNSALRELGNAAMVEEAARAVWRRGWVEQIGRDLAHAFRMLARSPVFSAVAILTLALGIGANTAIFSIARAVLVRGMPYPHLDRLVWISESLPKTPLNVSWPDFQDWRAQNAVFEEITVFQANRLYYTGGEEPKLVPGALAAASIFRTLGVRMEIGRPFTDAEDRPGAPPVAVISYEFWRNELKADPQIIGKELPLDGKLATVVGVLAPEFQFSPWQWSVYVPLAPQAVAPQFINRGNHPGLMAIARMRPGVTLERARSDMQTIMNRLAAAYPASNRNEKAVVVPLADQLVGSVRPTLLVLLGAVGFVLLMACANVAHLLLARTAARQREFAIRASLGASRGRLAQQLCAESALLSLLGGAAGLLLALWAAPRAVKLYPYVVPGLAETRVDLQVLLFALGACVLAAALFGLAPMLQASRMGIGAALQEGSPSAGARHGRRLRSALFVAEIAIAVVVTVGAGLLLRSLAAVLRVDPGFRADHLLAMDAIRTGRRDPQQDLQFFTRAAQNVAAVPGVRVASAAMCPPLSGTCWTSPYAPEGAAQAPPSQMPWTALNMILPNYFAVIQTPLIEGRFFTESDDARSVNTAILNRTLARHLWPHEPAVGKRILVTNSQGGMLEVIGVVDDIRQVGLEAPVSPEVFVPAAQMPVGFMTVVARTERDPAGLAHAASVAIQNVAAGQPPPKITAMTAAISASVAQRRFAAFLLGLFGAMALALAGIGVSGVMAYTVTQRTREFGIRMAVGARHGQVLRLVLRQGLALAALGVTIGLGAAWELSLLLSKMLFGVKAHDPATMLGAAGLLLALALAACLVPAWRAARVDPIRCLRCD